MPTKEIAKRVIDTLSDEATMDDIIHALYVKTKCENGEREVREGCSASVENGLLKG